MIVMDNIRGTHIRGQIARPAKAGKFPALLLLQYAGIYPLQKDWVVSKATNGWLTLNIQAHDIAVAEPEAYYQSLKAGSLTNYEAIGMDDRESSYFLRMYLACYRAAAYLRSRPDWDGRTLVVAGYSQGGQQTLITAALVPDITAAMACVPAGCDSDAVEAGRMPAYPWMLMQPKTPEEAAKVKQASRYFDAANFAPRVKCPLLVGIGGIDVVCPSPGIYAALNQMPCAKEIIFMPSVGHGGPHVAYDARLKEWLSLLKDGKSPDRNGNPTAKR
jgi:cephalosporin-C deacetylase-like acetyl esterase